MKLRSYLILMVNFAVSSAISLPTAGVEKVELNHNDTTTEDLTIDDIRVPPNIERSSILPGNNLWTSPVSYVLDKSLDLNAKGVIMRAFDQFRVKSCIDFKPQDSEEYYINIKKLNGCFSYVGRQFMNGQELSIGTGCDYLAIVEHEVLHALGFLHEQSRYDRDNFVRIILDNILKDRENNFIKFGSDQTTTNGVPYDYESVMHYSKNAFSNGKGPTIVTLDPNFKDVIGQRLEMSPRDVEELNLLYNCNTTVAFKFYCGFSNGKMCQMSHCSQSENRWNVVTQANGGPSSDHTTLPSESNDYGQQTGYFIHISTASGQKGDSARLETEEMKPNRECNVQCLEFYYFHSGNESDELNIWIREFQDELDKDGTLRLMERIIGTSTSHWKLHHVSLNATKNFQVVFEVRKGAGNSTGGFSIDDINLSETECPHVALQIDDFKSILNTNNIVTTIYSPRQYSEDGYAYRIAAEIRKEGIGIFVQLLSGEFNNELQWPSLQRQMIFQLLDQTPNKQLQMSKQITSVSDKTQVTSSGSSVWNNPMENGTGVFYEMDELVYGGPLFGESNFVTVDELQYREFLKGGSIIFLFNLKDLTPLIEGNNLPCPKLRPLNSSNPLPNLDAGPCLARNVSTVPPPSGTNRSIHFFCPGMVASPIVIVLLTMILQLS
ncbi:PREDICTED: meprin A subunit beta-like [Cyprinodon variegatus]|uniref:Metalloendopeptidase n=1 Tax=Cyprinodon variegatus TaxID=28743 RepID=A0A3Q2DA91_CYPVA|nr:PREDICTED: meprin A subunit beta-like [Cyprinodon variegatus]